MCYIMLMGELSLEEEAWNKKIHDIVLTWEN
jgi:hypothetical protein